MSQVIRPVIIAAMLENKIIAARNSHKLPWRSQAEFDHFYARIRGKTCLIGETTYLNLPKKVKELAKFHTVSKNKLKKMGYSHFYNYLDNVFSHSSNLIDHRGEGELLILGGIQIYAHVLNYAFNRKITSHIELSVINMEYSKILDQPDDYVYGHFLLEKTMEAPLVIAKQMDGFTLIKSTYANN